MLKMFDFKCRDCGHVFEDLLNEHQLEEKLYGPCPQCHSTQLDKLLSTHSDHVSWSYWRTPVTDYY